MKNAELLLGLTAVADVMAAKCTISIRSERQKAEYLISEVGKSEAAKSAPTKFTEVEC